MLLRWAQRKRDACDLLRRDCAPRLKAFVTGMLMCGYVCMGCGRCGKPRTMELPDIKCLKCGTLNEPGAARCSSCGEVFTTPGASGSKVAAKAKATC